MSMPINPIIVSVGLGFNLLRNYSRSEIARRIQMLRKCAFSLRKFYAFGHCFIQTAALGAEFHGGSIA